VTATVVTVGTFDGMHRGHRDVVQRLVERAAAAGLPSLLLTFDPHPLEVVNPAAAPPLLTSREEKIEILAETTPPRSSWSWYCARGSGCGSCSSATTTASVAPVPAT
jgi:isopentenyl diphosphate isomerase/L-lactate dehydrogenase-like FMN-dependent dehydrogenase